MKSLNIKKSSKESLEICSAIKLASKNTNIDENLILAIAYKESRLNFKAINTSTRDHGSMQINHATAKALKLDLHKLTTNRAYSYLQGSKVLQYFLKRYGLVEGIKRYNCGTRKSCVNYKVVIDYFLSVDILLSKNDRLYWRNLWNY
jgi:soluble lytic murein transglycosylase-like protein